MSSLAGPDRRELLLPTTQRRTAARGRRVVFAGEGQRRYILSMIMPSIMSMAPTASTSWWFHGTRWKHDEMDPPTD